MNKRLLCKHSLGARVVLLGALFGLRGHAASPSDGSPAQTINLDQALSEAMAHNPNLRAVLYDYRQAQAAQDAEEGLYRPSLILDSGITHSKTPRLTVGGTTISNSDMMEVGAELHKTFASGTALILRMQGDRTESSAPFGTGQASSVQLGPGYGMTGKLSLVQPLLRGFGNRVGLSTLRQAQFARSGKEQTRDRTASETLRDVVVGYWELWYAQKALEIEEAARDLAKQTQDETQARIAAGATAPVDLLTYQTRTNDLELSVLAARSTQTEAASNLNLLLGINGGPNSTLIATEPAMPNAPLADSGRVIQTAVEQSYEVKELEAQLRIAEDKARVAGEAERSRLDLDAYVQGQGLGNDRVPPAFEQFGTGDAVSAHVGLTLELPLSGARYSAEKRQAIAAIQSARAHIAAAVQAAAANAKRELLHLEQAQRRREVAELTVQIALANVVAQQQRYQHGDAIALEVNTAEDELRHARLNLERARVDEAQANIRIAHLNGRLLAQYSSIVPKEAPALFGDAVDLHPNEY
ncbi:MAG TPA: TolC family protein [Polyangiaceae bacterium]|nr:TolC family protein [Polyangiaceae bacterium]